MENPDSTLNSATDLAPPKGPELAKTERMLTFTGGGWVLVLAAILCLAVVVRSMGTRAPNGFDLSNIRVPAEDIVVAVKRDGFPSLRNPEALLQHELNKKWGSKFLVPSDRVVGVHIAGEARCYPLRVLNWHTTVNDIVGGLPILVTFHGPCDSAVIFDRRLDGEARTFGDSGMLFNSNLIFYDTQAETNDSSLFLQLRGEAIAGPLSGRTLERLSCELASYGDWMKRYPSSTIVPGFASLLSKCYKKRAYDSYLTQGQPNFKVDPLPDTSDGRKLFDPLLIIRRGDEQRILFFDDITAKLDAGVARLKVFDDLELDFVHHSGATTIDTPTIYPRLAEESQLTVSYARYFAWYAIENTKLGPVTPSESQRESKTPR